MPLIEVTVASTEFMLTTTAAVRLAKGTTSTGDEASLTASIMAASAWAQSYVGYPLVLQRYRESLSGYGGRSLILARTPVRAVPGLWDTTSTEDAVEVSSTAYTLDRGAGMIRRNQGWEWTVPVEPWLVTHPLPGQEFPAWMCDYVAGYTYNGISTAHALWSTVQGTTSTERTLPYDIEQAVIYKSLGIDDGSDEIVEEEIGDLKFRYGTFNGVTEEPKDGATYLLDKYRRIK